MKISLIVLTLVTVGACEGQDSAPTQAERARRGMETMHHELVKRNYMQNATEAKTAPGAK